MDVKSLSELEDEFIGKKGTPARDEYERELADLMIGYQLKNARIKLDLTQVYVFFRVIMYFFFRMPERKRYQKEKGTVCIFEATTNAFLCFTPLK